MHQTRREFLDDILDFVGHANDPGARNTMERILNRAIESMWNKRPWPVFLHPTAYEFSTLANTRAYGLPVWFGRVSGIDGAIRNLTTGQRLYPSTREKLEAEDPTVGTSNEAAGPPRVYYLAGVQPVHTQPAASGDALEVLSDSAADTAVSVLIGGINGDGQWTSVQVTLTGTVAVPAGTWREVFEFAKAYPDGTTPATEFTSSAGSVTLRKVTGATELQMLLPQESAREVRVLNLYPKPDQAYDIAVPFLRSPRKAWKDADVLPFGWGPALFEECQIEWQVQAGDLSRQAAAQTARPAFIDLTCNENAAAAQMNRRREPFRG